MLRLQLPEGYHLAGSTRYLGLGRFDPSARFAGGTFWLAAHTPAGPGSLGLTRDGDALAVTAHGEGADWLLGHADAIAGLRDDISDFPGLAAAHPVVTELARVHRGIRLPATGLVFPRLARAILEQKVTGKEAFRGWSGLVRRYGTPAPGPCPDLWVPPAAEVVAGLAYWALHPLGVEQRRAQTILRAAALAATLARCPDSASLTRRLLDIPGIGPWTAAETVRTVFGDADAVSVGDFHIPNTVAWGLAGEARGDDARMLALLAPFAGHRGRVCVLLEAAGIAAPRFGPRMPIRSFARF
ncbi:3-methyladenine DNA glycosylase/8-oxoguanine DNA glycosylase [Catenuloplanes nepalensis]|uniref:3-methyladenine DNA glycosylase/8-oxoguanine DNA glycosylase n=1 Tax=Catenuloplanes nepalensis TaxID=587533 RepID=A0ABT9MZM4_9ACTN|nr:DNA-3-methyladenine glycosylase 2 family protein [Catenuloplanes nepalensis]MDP9796901.1 3-methyladenine DNA glycosylase/8-oxoguanine DNA glycosylase [Catenuloplanes nepalensis]